GEISDTAWIGHSHFQVCFLVEVFGQRKVVVSGGLHDDEGRVQLGELPAQPADSDQGIGMANDFRGSSPGGVEILRSDINSDKYGLVDCGFHVALPYGCELGAHVAVRVNRKRRAVKTLAA